MTQDTGIPIYVEATKRYRLQYPQHRLLVEFIGDGPARSLSETVGLVHGFQSSPRTYINQAHFVFASNYLSILEAFSASKLVFAVYDNPLKYDYLTLSPFADKIIIAHSPARLVERLHFYSTHPQSTKTLIHKARKWANSQTWNQVADIYLRLWSSYLPALNLPSPNRRGLG